MIATSQVRRTVFVSVQVGFLVLVLSSAAVATPGDLDTTFSGDGRVKTRFGGDSVASGLAIQSDGKIVVAGGVSPPSGGGKIALTRYTPGGELDPTFGGDGRVTTAFVTRVGASAVAIQHDDKIVVCGNVLSPSVPGRLMFALARYNPDGSLDATFGGNGRVTTAFGGNAFPGGVAVQDDGKIVAAGSVILSVPGMRKIALARYNSDGSLDATFSGNGRVTTAFAGDAFATGVAVQSDNKIVAAGGLFPTPFTQQRIALARYNPDGSLDATFGGNGRVTTAFAGNAFAQGVTVQDDGNIVAVGSLFPLGRQRFALTRYTPDGALDSTFGGDGRVTTAFGGNANGSAVALQDDGKIVAAGSMIAPVAGMRRIALARYNSDGSPDANFGGNGRVTTQFADNAQASGVAIQEDGKVVVAGTVSRELFPLGGFAVARYTAV